MHIIQHIEIILNKLRKVRRKDKKLENMSAIINALFREIV